MMFWFSVTWITTIYFNLQHLDYVFLYCLLDLKKNLLQILNILIVFLVF